MACDQYPNCRNTENVRAGFAPEPVVAEKITTSKATPRSSAAITATELIRYATKLHENYCVEIGRKEGTIAPNFGEVCQEVWAGYHNFLKALE